MTPDAAFVEMIVNEVLGRLSQAARVTGSDDRPAAAARGPTESVSRCTAPATRSAAEEQYVTEKVVSLDVVGATAPQIRCLVVRPDAVVTPAVLDWARENGMHIERRAAANAVATCRLVAASDLAAAQSPLWHELQRYVAPAQCWTASDANQILRLVEPALADPGTRVAFLTRQPALALCTANRNPAIRAAWGLDLMGVREAMATLQPNLLIIDPARLDHQSLGAMITQFRCIEPPAKNA